MVRAWLKRLAKQWLGSEKACTAKPPVRLGLEALEAREVPSVAKSMELTANGNLYMSSSGAPLVLFKSGYSPSVGYGNAGVTFSLDGSGNLSMNGVVWWGDVQDFTLGKDGRLWLQHIPSFDGGDLSEQTAPFSSPNHWLSVDSGITSMAADFNGNGDIWAVNGQHSLVDETTNKYGWINMKAFAFDPTGNLFMLTTNATNNQLWYFNFSNPSSPWTFEDSGVTMLQVDPYSGHVWSLDTAQNLTDWTAGWSWTGMQNIAFSGGYVYGLTAQTPRWVLLEVNGQGW